MSQFLFVNPSSHRVKGATAVALTMPPMGLLSLAAVVESKGHLARIIDANLQQIDPENILVGIKECPMFIGMTVNVLTIKMALEYAEVLKQAFPQAVLAFGGPHASVMGRKLLDQYPCLDAVMRGEGEATLADIVQRLGQKDILEGVRGLVYRRNGEIIDNGKRELIPDIDTLPFPAYHLGPHLARYRTRSRAFPVGYIFTSRGCPAACTFCYRSFGTQWRPRSPEKVVEEIAFLRETYGIRQLDILDDNFTFDAQRASRILELIILRRWDLKINLQVGVRVHSLTPELLRLMKRAGVFKFGFGIESGDEEILRRIKKGLKLERALALVREARRLGFITHGYFMIGFPGDTPASMRRTIDFAKTLNPHYASFSMCTPLPGTEIYDDIARHGEFLVNIEDGIDEGVFALKGFFKYGDLTPEISAAYCETAWREFYCRPGKVVDVVKTVRSWGEFQWLMRVGADLVRSRKR